MICSNCNKEITNGSLYCIYCHAPTGLENDIDVSIDILEDDELLQTYQEERDKVLNKNKNKDTKQEQAEEVAKKKSRPTIIIIAIIAIILAAVVINISMNSYSQTLKKANASFNKGDYEYSLSLYERCLNKKSDSIDAMIGMGMSYIGIQDYEKAEEIFIKAIETDADSIDAFSALMKLYSMENDQEKILSAGEEYAKNDNQKKIMEEYLIEYPSFSVEGDENLTDDIYLALTSASKKDIYYTLDGNDPREGNGFLYEKEIEIKEGTTVVKACCYDGKTFGNIKEEKYVIKYDTPSYPTVTPMNGEFYEPTTISISSEQAGAKIYYTWDGSDPSENSTLYSGPIDVIEGNNVLSVIVIGANGKQSGILRCSYTYFP